jgi:hypothetical protein
VTDGLFPALDADIAIAAEDDQHVKVTLTGCYRPLLGPLGARLDRLILRKVATATITTLLTRITSALRGDLAASAEEARPQAEAGAEPAA